jgi:hypothetical protein
MKEGSDRVKSVERSIRLDLLIAVCALLISSLAMAASWLQSRETARQTTVLEEQLGAQVWPYVDIGLKLDGNDLATISLENDGLGPAVLYSMTATVDGKPQSNFLEVLHAILGPHLVRRRPHGEAMGFDIDNESVGSVLRPGELTSLLRFKSRHYAQSFVFAYRRMDFRVCYCAILPGKCWQSNTIANSPPQSIPTCQTIPNDILHSNVLPDPKLL